MHNSAADVRQLRRIERGPEAWHLAGSAYTALFAELDTLTHADWELPTVCAPWTVADIVRHLLGAAEGHASIGAMLRQQGWALRHRSEFGGSTLDAWTALHVRRHADLDPNQLLDRLRQEARRAVRGRARLPALLGGIRVPLDRAGTLPEGSPTHVTLGELNTVTYTRDCWLHRIDIARATGRPPQLDPGVDGRIVEDVVVEWARRHAAPFRLVLTGAAGGSFTSGSGGPELRLDAVEFAWILSGRAEPETSLPGADLLRTRVLF